ncbi:hypothetical protein M0805_002989 [Coniferiporia weirii]|nr:hypothetical protein M0805_002989 [Coniferiporia weirii]
MVASSSSTASAGRPQPLSYAERAKRAGASTASQPAAHAHPAMTNGVTRVDDGPTSHASSSMNVTSKSPAAPAHPASPPSPQLLPAPNTDEPQSFPPMPKSPSKPPPPNVWMARKEQMARVAVQQQQTPTVAQSHSGNAEKANAAPRAPLNGIMNTSSHDEPASSAPNKSPDDPFVVRIPAHSRSPPSLDDTESWPEMGKHGPSASTSTSVSTTAGSSSGGNKKGEKPKWVPILPSELQATHDALAAQSSAKSRTHSQHRRSNPTKSHSRHQSQARQGQGGVNAVPSNGMRQPQFGFASNEASAAQSRAESTTHSRTTSVHSSPRYPTRGRRLPEERANDAHSSAGPSTGTKKLINGEVASGFPPSEVQPTTYQHAYSDSVADPAQNLTGPHSQSHTPYSSHSPVYYPPPVPPNSSVQPYGYSAMPPNVGYTVMPPPPVPGLGHASTHAHHQQNYAGYPTYGLPQHLPPNQPPYPYMYAPAPFPYYALQAPGQSHERPPPEQPLLEKQELEVTHVSPNLPPASALTRPPPPEQSAALAGYRAIAAVPVSPLLGASDAHPNISEVSETSGEVLFGSLGRPDGMKSPSPVSSPVAVDNHPRRTPTAFAVGFEGPPTIRMKRSGSTKDGIEAVVDAVKVIDLTDQETTWEFGTSAHPDADSTDKNESENVPGPSQASQIVQPQPHMIQYPPPPVPPVHQAAGYNMGPPTHLPMPVSLPIPSQSPLGPVQPPPHVPSLAPLTVGPGFVSPLALASPGPGPGAPGPVSAGAGTGDEWEVRDFGYGFGAFSGSGYIPERLREERFEREHRDGYREPREFANNGFGGRGRRGGGANGFGGYYEGGRGGFVGRRGRGGPNGFGRGFSRGGFAGRGGHGTYQRHQPALNVVTGPFHHQPGLHTPHNQQQPQLHPHQVSPDVPNGYYSSPSAASSQYVTSPYGQYNPGLPLPLPLPPQPQLQPPIQPQSLQQAPPMPMPVTALSFPLDPVGHYLLGQVEYYFSIQNLMSDVFLKKQMDSKGWIPIDLIASFNRIKRLTTDVRMVADVLSLSSLVEVRDGHVRLVNRQWANFVLPGARTSTVSDGDFDVSGSQSLASGQHVDEEAEKEVDEEEEDDVVFVLGGEESRPWTLDRDRSQMAAAGGAS